MSPNNRLSLEDGGMPVSMAKISRELQTVCVVGMVYTPPYFRGRGYATSCVAAVSQFGLDRVYKKCVLYTDLANPTSNSIYMKIGYRPICDSINVMFGRTE
jgi:predicted GNAT family acetyltransferase